jgi:hypothetical protein
MILKAFERLPPFPTGESLLGLLFKRHLLPIHIAMPQQDRVSMPSKKDKG